mmetsp:Transcript_15509/g.40156  ORF Transcript_15509/g.40156 Transcript_15509/m.40156 type:complete len:486 (-) Transcript_15509:37-1494(-)|eukprot:CAMPEP_0182942688 /NCGR_PEP_ID=MMETSP0105_2-20130417/51133_1 /TAXON_ID=81532 ORGANISM="Acanthoeca-like sp., Strain 10tr" /NCGR_SAMPLE_ID=MMETSP0105_2 /ASSEMBLY_ACC=CAM_ASM_000205 /LENGTH=485 /DNA_ID=CAMNT_0025082457 /DNA_START=177 /DNA_END=1634 /DNA_ORIENTATION=-
MAAQPPPRPPLPKGHAAAAASPRADGPRASEMLLPEQKRVQLMEAVRDGKISQEEALEVAAQHEGNLERRHRLDEKKRAEELGRMTPKVRAQALAIERRKAEDAKDRKRIEVATAVPYVSPPCASTAGAFAPPLDLPASKMRLSDEKRIEVMSLVKAGELTVDQAMVRIRMLEQALQEHEMHMSGYQPVRTPSMCPKRVRFATTTPEEALTHSRWEYDRKKDANVDYDANRYDWDNESEEETQRQLEVRWAHMEKDLPEGTQCEERTAHAAHQAKVSALEAEARRKKAAKREAERERVRQTKKRQADARKNAEISRLALELEVNAAAVRALLATLERRIAAEKNAIKMGGVQPGLSLGGEPGAAVAAADQSDDDASPTPDIMSPRTTESFIQSEMERIRMQARQTALRDSNVLQEASFTDEGDGSPPHEEALAPTFAPPPPPPTEQADNAADAARPTKPPKPPKPATPPKPANVASKLLADASEA